MLSLIVDTRSAHAIVEKKGCLNQLSRPGDPLVLVNYRETLVVDHRICSYTMERFGMYT